MLRRIVRNIAAVPHAANHVADRAPGRGAVTLRQFLRELTAGKEHGPVAVVVVWQHSVIDDESECETSENGCPGQQQAPKAQFIDSPCNQHKPDPEEKPKGITPHRNGAAAAERRQCQHGRDWSEGEPRNDTAIECIGTKPDFIAALARQEQRQTNQQRRDEEDSLADAKLKRMPDMVDQPARRQGAMFGVSEGQEIVLHEPHEVRRHCNQGRRHGHVRSRRCQGLAGSVVEHDKHGERHGQYQHEVFGP